MEVNAYELVLTGTCRCWPPIGLNIRVHEMVYLFVPVDSTHLHVQIAVAAEAKGRHLMTRAFAPCSLLHFLAAAAHPSLCPSNFRYSFRLLRAASLLRTKSSDLAAALAVTILPTAHVSPLAADHPPAVDAATKHYMSLPELGCDANRYDTVIKACAPKAGTCKYGYNLRGIKRLIVREKGGLCR